MTSHLHRRLSLSLLLLSLVLTLTSAQAFRVVIDPGHGGYDHGAQAGRVYEKHLAFDTARRLQRYLTKRGIAVTLTRSRDEFISLERRVSIGASRRDSIFISIHYNSASNRSATGLETFYYNSQSELLAQLVQYNALDKLRSRDRGVKYRGFRVLRTSVPAILVEGGFLSNSSECRTCVTPSFRQKLAEAIGYSVIRYRKIR